MYIKDRKVAGFFEIEDIQQNPGFQAFGQTLEYTSGASPHIILLGQERTLYDYKIEDLYEVYQKVGTRVLLILCQGLRAARGNGERHWINTQHGISNFNMNMLLETRREHTKNIWGLQEKISVAIAQYLPVLSPESSAGIAYPFHYTLEGGKVAGHLIQKKDIGETGNFLRIGIGLNSARKTPGLPANDELAQKLYKAPTSIPIEPPEWPTVASMMSDDILTSLEGGSKHLEYLRRLNLKKGQIVSVREDTGSIAFGKELTHGIFDTIGPDGSIILRDGTLPGGKDYHIVRN